MASEPRDTIQETCGDGFYTPDQKAEALRRLEEDHAMTTRTARARLAAVEAWQQTPEFRELEAVQAAARTKYKATRRLYVQDRALRRARRGKP